VTTIERRASPFDSIRYLDPEGGEEFWYARELAPLLGYSQWRHFNSAINRARTSMSEDGRYSVKEHFWVVKRPAEVRVGKATKTSDQGGRPSIDFRLTRPACYFIAMNGDVKKPQIAAAQQYFVIQTMRMEAIEETAAPVPAQMPTHIQALRGWADALEAQERAEKAALEAQQLVEELRPPAEAWNALAASGSDCSITEAAHILNRAEGVTTGPGRLARWMLEMRLVYRRAGGQTVPYAEHSGHIRLRPTPAGTTEIRITPDGLSWILQRLRQEQARPALTIVPDQKADVIPIRGD